MLFRSGASNRTILATGAGPNRRQNKYVVLADGAGKLTPAGTFYYQTTGAERPRAAFSQDQELISRGGNDYIRTRDRREALVRSLRPDGSTRITQLGRGACDHKGDRANQTRPDWLPVHKLGISGIMEQEQLTEAQAHARVKSRVLSELGLRTPIPSSWRRPRKCRAA